MKTLLLLTAYTLISTAALADTITCKAKLVDIDGTSTEKVAQVIIDEMKTITLKMKDSSLVVYQIDSIDQKDGIKTYLARIGNDPYSKTPIINTITIDFFPSDQIQDGIEAILNHAATTDFYALKKCIKR